MGWRPLHCRGKFIIDIPCAPPVSSLTFFRGIETLKGCCFFISALLGWFIGQFNILNSEDKRNKSIAVICFISINVIIIALLGKFSNSYHFRNCGCTHHCSVCISYDRSLRVCRKCLDFYKFCACSIVRGESRSRRLRH